ncbi:MAG: hypothetical protein AABX13_04305 [Nanoarchaeota archaeon]
MITYQDQMELFRLLANAIKKDITCYAFGGNAMMFYGYKEETKDVDLLLEDQESRREFTLALRSLGYMETSATRIYLPEKLKDPNAPLVYKKGEGRFDLFIGSIFRTLLSPKMKEDLFAVHEFKSEHTLTVKVFNSEFIVLLKSVTSRDRDFEDIVTIVKKDKHFGWQYLIDEVLWQYQHGDSLVLLDVEKMLQELKKYVLVEEKYFKQLHQAGGRSKTSSSPMRRS